MGTPDFAVLPLKRLYEEGHDIAAVVTQPDRPKGRHGELSAPPVKIAATELSLPVLQPDKASEPSFIAQIRELDPEVIVVAAYGQILKPELLSLPKRGCINIHASLLPRWRGASPIAMSIISGDSKTGITTMYMEEGLDTGDILLQESIPIEADDTEGSLTEKLSVLGAELICRTLCRLSEGSLRPLPQADTGIPSTYAGLMKKSDGELDFSRDALEAERRVRGLYPWPGAFVRIDGKTLKIHSCLYIPEEGLSVSLKALSEGCLRAEEDGIYLRFSKGGLRLIEIQLEGKKRMAAEEFLRGSRSFIDGARCEAKKEV